MLITPSWEILETLCKPILEPLKTSTSFKSQVLDFSVWIALILLRMISRYLISLLVVLWARNFTNISQRRIFHSSIRAWNGWVKLRNTNALILSPFINPHQVFILETLGNNRGLKVFSSTSYISSEYTRVILAPDYFTPSFGRFWNDLAWDWVS